VSDKELYQQKMQAQLDAWKAEVDKLKARASGLSADARLEMGKHIETLDSKIEEAKVKLSELAQAGEEAWPPLKEGMESAWDTLKSAVSEAVEKFKT